MCVFLERTHSLVSVQSYWAFFCAKHTPLPHLSQAQQSKFLTSTHKNNMHEQVFLILVFLFKS